MEGGLGVKSIFREINLVSRCPSVCDGLTGLHDINPLLEDDVFIGKYIIDIVVGIGNADNAGFTQLVVNDKNKIFLEFCKCVVYL